MKFSREEQETTINYDALTMEWDVYTCCTGHINVLMKNDRIPLADIEVLTEWEGKPTSIRFKVGAARTSLPSLFKKPRAKQEPSEKQLQARKAFADRMRNKQYNSDMETTLEVSVGNSRKN